MRRSSSLATEPPADVHRVIGAFAALVGVAVLASAFAFQHLGGYAPCPLCIWQRWPWVVVVVAALVGVVSPASGRIGLALALLALLTGVGLAGFHVGVEEKWWQGLASCASPTTPAASIEELRARLSATTVPACDAAAWRLFGVSMAGYNFAIGVALALVVATGVARASRSA